MVFPPLLLLSYILPRVSHLISFHIMYFNHVLDDASCNCKSHEHARCWTGYPQLTELADNQLRDTRWPMLGLVKLGNPDPVGYYVFVTNLTLKYQY